MTTEDGEVPYDEYVARLRTQCGSAAERQAYDEVVRRTPWIFGRVALGKQGGLDHNDLFGLIRTVLHSSAAARGARWRGEDGPSVVPY